MKTLVGKYKLGLRPVQLFLETGSTGGSAELIPDDNSPTKVYVGIDQRWPEAVSTLLHELYEVALIDLNTRYGPRPNFSEESSDFIFLMTHNQLSEAHERVAYALVSIMPDFDEMYEKLSRKIKR